MVSCDACGSIFDLDKIHKYITNEKIIWKCAVCTSDNEELKEVPEVTE